MPNPKSNTASEQKQIHKGLTGEHCSLCGWMIFSDDQYCPIQRPRLPTGQQDISTITFDKNSTQFILQTFKDIPAICFNCKKKITVKNIGGIRNGTGMVCKNIACIIAFSDEQKKDWAYAND